MLTQYLAHSKNKAGKSHPLKKHLSEVARLAKQFSQNFPWQEEAVLAALLHDLGKYGELFQKRLRGEASGIDHWSPGGWVAVEKCRSIGAALAVQGHHIGLQSLTKYKLQDLSPKKLRERHPLNLTLSESNLEKLICQLEAEGLSISPPDKKVLHNISDCEQAEAARMLDVRLLFSVLVDADFLNTEAHFEGNSQGLRYRPPAPDFDSEKAFQVLEQYMNTLRKKSKADKKVNRMRDDLWEICITAASEPPGLRTLTAPTGSGKTEAMLGFALRHAAEQGLRRVVMVIPYLTIIEQTAGRIRRIFGDTFSPGYILEHHSMAGVGSEIKERQSDAEEEADRNYRLLSDNWEAPIIITTSVQLLESLFSNRSSACRKLHRLAESVILFDEVQTLPVPLAIPTLATLSHLSHAYRSTVMFATATQPAFDHLDQEVRRWSSSGWTPRETVPPELNLFGLTQRTKVQWPDLEQPTDWDSLCEDLKNHDQVLCVVNLKRHARDIVQRLKDKNVEGLLHLSTDMCPAHRQEVLRQVNRRLDKNQPCVLIATQCVEAGVNLDFPVVYRAFGPLDAIAQVDGRCNRNGKLPLGDMVIFFPTPDGKRMYPTPAYEQAAAVTAKLLRDRGPDRMCMQDPTLYRAYYEDLYDITRPEELQQNLQEAIKGLDFVETAKEYRLIKQDSINVLVPYALSGRASLTLRKSITNEFLDVAFGNTDLTEFRVLEEIVFQKGLSRKWIRCARSLSISLYRPRDDDPIQDYLMPVPLTKGKRSAQQDWRNEWFIYREPDHYDPLMGLVPPNAPPVWAF